MKWQCAVVVVDMTGLPAVMWGEEALADLVVVTVDMTDLVVPPVEGCCIRSRCSDTEV